MLAKSYKWNAARTQIDFTIRSGVKWNDGEGVHREGRRLHLQPHEARQVHRPVRPVDHGGTPVGHRLRRPGSPLKFEKAAQPCFYAFAHQVAIVPEHVFGKGEAASKPDTWVDKSPSAPARSRSTRAPRTTSSTRRTPTTGSRGQAVHPEGRVPGLPRQRPLPTSTSPAARPSGGASSSPASSSSTSGQVARQPHLVATRPERRHLPEPRSVPQEHQQPQGPPGDLVRHRPREGLPDRRRRTGNRPRTSRAS